MDSPKEIFVVVKAYIDESRGSHRTFALGCVIAKGTEWFWLNNDWKRCLERKNRELKRNGRKHISRYHASDCESRRGEFSGWDVPEKNRFIAELISIVNKYHVHIVGYTLDLADLLALFPQIDPERGEKAAYGVLAWQLFPEIAREANHLDPQPAVKVIYEHGDVAQHMPMAFDRMIASRPFGAIFDSLVKDSWKVLPLQVADLVAFETMKDRDNQKGESKRDRRLSLRALISNESHGGGRGLHLSREGLQQLADRAMMFA